MTRRDDMTRRQRVEHDLEKNLQWLKLQVTKEEWKTHREVQHDG